MSELMACVMQNIARSSSGFHLILVINSVNLSITTRISSLIRPLQGAFSERFLAQVINPSVFHCHCRIVMCVKALYRQYKSFTFTHCCLVVKTPMSPH